MQYDIKVSAIVAVYNAAPFLDKCLMSLCDQTLREIEIICVDDGSTDGSLQILNEYAERDSRIKVIHLEKGSTGPGAADARNAGIDAARGEYLSILDSDDYFDIHLFEKTYNRAKAVCESGADIVMYNGRTFDSRTEKFTDVGTFLVAKHIPDKEVFSRKDFAEHLFQSTNGAAWCELFRREFIINNNLRFKPHYHTDDLFFTFAALIMADSITAVNEKLIFYREHNPNSQTARRMSNPLSATDAWRELSEYLKNNHLYEDVKKSFMNQAVYYFRWYLENMESEKTFSVMYDELKSRALKEVGFIEGTDVSDGNIDDFYDASLYNWCCDISNKSQNEFIYDRLLATSSMMYEYDPQFAFPRDMVRQDERIILYGAGNTGQRYFTENLKCRYCNIVAWADMHADDIGGMLVHPDNIKNIKYDRILIASGSTQVYESIKHDLLAMGITKNRII